MKKKLKKICSLVDRVVSRNAMVIILSLIILSCTIKVIRLYLGAPL